ncbi:hypothetical protein HWV62_39289 [Athelia sp. TMB]|nr:hypothetical protein HWV62_39289 [Athelia sp. TMB]
MRQRRRTLSFDTPGRCTRTVDDDAPLTLGMLAAKPSSPVGNTRGTAGTPTRALPAKTTAGLGSEIAQRKTLALELREGGGDEVVGSLANPKRYAALKVGVEFLLADALKDDIHAPQLAADVVEFELRCSLSRL